MTLALKIHTKSNACLILVYFCRTMCNNVQHCATYMNSHDLRVSIITLLDQTDDSEVLSLIYAFLVKLSGKNADDVVAYEADGTPITNEELIESILQSSRDVRQNGIISHQDMKAQLGITD